MGTKSTRRQCRNRIPTPEVMTGCASVETNLSHIQQEVSLLCWIRTRKTDPEAAAGQEAKAVVRGHHASRGSWARRSGHRRLQAELTRPGPRILAPGSGTRLRLLPAKLPARLGGPRVPHARGSPPPARSGVPILQGGLCALRARPPCADFIFWTIRGRLWGLSSSTPHAAAFRV